MDKDGLIHPIDSANAVNFHKKIQQELAVNVLKGITPKVDTSQGKHTGKYITDNQYDTYWASNKRKGASIEFRLPKAKEISRLMLQEYIPLGQRVKAFSVYYLQGKNWVKLQQKEENIDRKTESIERKEANLAAKEESLNKQKEEIAKLSEERVKELERISGLTSDQAKDYLLKIVEEEVKHETAVMVK